MEKQFIKIGVDVLMHRNLYIEVPSDFSEEEIIDRAKREIILPHEVLNKIAEVLKQPGLKITGLDLKDWLVDNVNFQIYGRDEKTDTGK